jgi:dynein heavy chain
VIYCPEPTHESFERMLSLVLDAYLHDQHSSLKKLNRAIPRATIIIFRSIQKNCRPTISRHHYIFNSRDLWKVLRGMVVAFTPNMNAQHLIKLWFHECLRVFGDRLSNNTDRQWFNSLMVETAKQVLEIEHPTLNDQVFIAEVASGAWEEVSDIERFILSMRTALNDYNLHSKSPMDIHLFSEAVRHMVRISRIIKQPQVLIRSQI